MAEARLSLLLLLLLLLLPLTTSELRFESGRRVEARK